MSHFESTVCGRCGGSGHYSFNLRHGTVCFGCSGSGVKLTKRGKVARDYFINSMMIPVEELKEGDFIKFFTLDKKFKEVFIKDEGSDVELAQRHVCGHSTGEAGNRRMFYIEAKDGCAVKVYPETLIRKAQSEDEKKVKLQQALAYQDTLNANGTPKKRSAKKV